MNEVPEQTAPAEDEVILLSRLVDEIRADVGWREEIEALRKREALGAVEADGTTDPAGQDLEQVMPERIEPSRSEMSAPRLDPAIPAAIGQAEAAIDAADAVVPISSGVPVLGTSWAELRRRIHAEIRIYQDRQTTVNRDVASALRYFEMALDPARAESPMAAVWMALGQLDALLRQTDERLRDTQKQVEKLQLRLDRMDTATGARASAVNGRLRDLEQASAALQVEVEPLGGIRARLAELETKLAEIG